MRPRALWGCLAVIVGIAGVAGAPGAQAQTRHITPRSPVPAVRNDTIYALAVDSSDYPDHVSILLLDDVVVTVQHDGRYTMTNHEIVQVLRQAAVKDLQEWSLNYDPDHQHTTVNWVRVLKPNGSVISEKPSQMQESDVSPSTVDPVYAHRKLLRLSLTGVAPGTLIDVSWTTEERDPYRPGDFYLRWRLAMHTSVRRGRLAIDAPRDMALHMIEHHLDFARRDTVIGLRRVYQWSKQQVLWHKLEWFAPPLDSTDAAVGIDVAAPATWRDVGRWFGNLAGERLRPSKRLRDTVAGVVARATTLEDSVHAIHRWVTQDIRYVEIAMGLGGFQPRFPDTVLTTGFGDSKDKSTLLIDALGLIGVQAFPVLSSVSSRPDSELPTIHAFDHELVAIKRPAGYQYVDPASEFSRLDALPSLDAGKFALVIHPDGQIEDVTTPADSTDFNQSVVILTGELASDGTFSGRVVATARGGPELYMRALASPAQDSAQRMGVLQSLVSSSFPDAKVDSVVLFNGKDFSAKAVVSYAVHSTHPVQRSGDVDILANFDPSAAFTEMASGVGRYRSQPIDAARILPSATLITETHVTLPPGWKARLPPSTSATSVFGTLEVTYEQTGRTLSIIRRSIGGQGLYAKNRFPEVATWLRECAKDHAPIIVIDHGPPKS